MGRRTATRPVKLAFRAARACVEAAPTILVVGLMPHIDWLRALGLVKRARWRLLAPRAAQSGADLVVVGRPAAGADAVAVIAWLKASPATAAIPVLHAGEGGCPGRCGADFCLSTGSASGQLARVAEALLELARARARSSGLVAATPSVAGSRAAPPAA